jgi:BirA family biotin operon repressor/biotin-[acetyl-CoA-carboxylase] ligase
VSRAAVGKRIVNLREGGLEIEAVPNRGYRLAAPENSLGPQQVTPLLTTDWLGRLYLNHKRLASTNAEASRMAAEGAPHGTVVVADEQTAGRGRLGRTWHSPADGNLYLSVVLRPRLRPVAAPPITLAAAVGVAQGVRGFVGQPPVVKWPNDLLYGGRKFCGILVELNAEPLSINHLILGVGINVNVTRFPDELASRATSLRIERGSPLKRTAVLASVLNRLEPWIDRLVQQGPTSVIEAWSELAPWLGQTVTVHQPGGQIRGVAVGLDPDGALLVQCDTGQQRVVSGDLELPARF